jgi:hypothetical protein
MNKLPVERGHTCERLHRVTIVGARAKRIQCDEIWAFVHANAKNAKPAMVAAGTAGDVWTWTGLDPDSKLMVSWLVGHRDPGYAHAFVEDAAYRLANRVQLTTDGNRLYLTAVEDAFGIGRGLRAAGEAVRPVRRAGAGLPPARCIGARKHALMGNPGPAHISYLDGGAPEPRHADEHAPA